MVNPAEIQLLSIAVTIVLALVGYFVTYLNNLRLARRADRLTYITSQIRDFYGPLYVITQTSRVLYDAFRIESQGRHGIDADLMWRTWAQAVFIPMNAELERVITTKSYLIREAQMHPALLRFCAHSAACRALSAQWAQNDFRSVHPSIQFPEELDKYAIASYQSLREEEHLLRDATARKIALKP